MRLVFMGTPSFAVPVLDALVSAEDVQVVAVFTMPDRPRGRGRSPEMSPVKTYALERGLEVHQPASLRRERAQQELADLQPEVIVVAAYGNFLPSQVLHAPPHGCLNLHPSLLPRYRGPSPVASAILDGVTVTGVTLMLLDQGMDTGPIIMQREYPISSKETAEGLTFSLFQMGSRLLLENLASWMAGVLTSNPQDGSRATVTRKFERKDGLADWNLPAAVLERRRRAFTPWPGLYTTWQGRGLKLLDVAALTPPTGPGFEPGLVVALPDRECPAAVATGDGLLGLKSLQLEGRRALTAAEFLRGQPQFLGSQL